MYYKLYYIDDDGTVGRRTGGYGSSTLRTNRSLPIYNMAVDITNVAGVIINTPDFGDVIFEGPFSDRMCFTFTKYNHESDTPTYGFTVCGSRIYIATEYYVTNVAYAIRTSKETIVNIKWLLKK